MLVLGLDPHARHVGRATAPLSRTECYLALPYMWAFLQCVICVWTKLNIVSGCVLLESKPAMRVAR